VFVSGTKAVPKTTVLETTCIKEKKAPEMIALTKASGRGVPVSMKEKAIPKLVIMSYTSVRKAPKIAVSTQDPAL
jgi:hypothetical protein